MSSCQHSLSSRPPVAHPKDGRAVRFVSAMAAPLLPLLVLLCCMAVELMKPGLGITAALQVP